ncbi:DUF1389 domain-containing protein [Chlamydia vaughanii]|uniref:DUF1389 domain-containing protein n=1 Tax=Chlamydia vaughanii TaxID=3112552 RepID=UPI0039F622EB
MVVTTQNTLNSQVKQTEACPLSQKKAAHRLALIVGGVIFTLFAGVCITLLACGFIHLAVVAGIVISLCIARAMIASAIRSFRMPKSPQIEEVVFPNQAIPEYIVEIINSWQFPEVVRSICKEQHLTIQELKAILQGLQEGDFSSLPPKVKGKLEAFGISRFENGFVHEEEVQREVARSTLETILTVSCPFYFLKKFIDLGPKDVPQAEGMLPEVYWTGSLALNNAIPNTAFDTFSWMFGQVITEEEYAQLRYHARNETWDQVADIVSAVEGKMLNKLEDPLMDPSIKKKRMREAINLKYPLLYLCQHGMSWEQVKMLKEMSFTNAKLMYDWEVSGQLGMNLVRSIAVIYPYLDEESPNYDTDIALIAWGEWMAGTIWQREQSDQDAHEMTIAVLNQRIKNKHLEVLPRSGDGSITTHCYAIDTQSGRRGNKIQKAS